MGPHQIARVRLLAKPAVIVPPGEDHGHAVVDVGNEVVCVGRDDRERADPLARGGMLPVLPDAGDAERTAVFRGDRVGLLRP